MKIFTMKNTRIKDDVMMKKYLTGWFLVLGLMMSLFARGMAETVQRELAEPASVVIGTSTAPDGNLGLGLWSDNATDIELRLLLHGYETVSLIRMLGVAFNQTVLHDVREEVQADGDVVVIFELVPDITYNNGQLITARDYVFSLLLLASPELAALGAKPGRLEYLRGYDEYHAGTSSVLAGVRLLSETSFSMRVRAEAMPYFYGFARLEVRPYPIFVIAPGCTVADDGQGAYLQDGTAGVTETERDLQYTPGHFSMEMLTVTLLDPISGYEVNPRVTCGPYQLETYDPILRIVRLRVNDHYIGNFEGQKPAVTKLEVRYAPPDQMLSLLSMGELDIATRVADKDAVRQGRRLVDERGNVFAMEYPRTGMAMLAFACERGPLANQAVRKAVALSMDKEMICEKIGGEYARRVYGYYGKDQWMPEYVSDPAGNGELLDMPNELAQLNIPQDLSAAIALLEADRWMLNSEGNPFREHVDTMRYRNEEGRLVPLLLWFALPEESTTAQQISAILEESLGSVGIGVRSVQMSFNEALAQLYRKQERMFDVFFLSNNFSYLFDPFYELNPGEAMMDIANKTGIRDEELEKLAIELRFTPTLDRDAYAVKWLAFQRQFMETLPMLPLYSSTYFDFCSDRLERYAVDVYSGWALSVPYMRVAQRTAD